jgi:outer membrane lipoprotein carrier protein
LFQSRNRKRLGLTECGLLVKVRIQFKEEKTWKYQDKVRVMSQENVRLKQAAAPWGAVLLLTLGLSLGQVVPGWAITPEEVVTQVQKQYDSTGVFKARFHQESKLKSQASGDTAQGVLYFKKPSQMRWDYQSPSAQKKEVIADGREVYIYMPQDKTVMVYPMKQVMRSDLVMRFFSGIGELQRDFKVSWNTPYSGYGPMRILLKPTNPQPDLKDLILTIDPQTYLVQSLEFSNTYGDFTRMSFSGTQLNVSLEPGFFKFTPPPGVQVVREKM